ncbi:FAD-dependent oxidoreductase [Limnohabitans sp. TS-CS-82]|uniref:NAD(P)/FAD-dependent oxidoreductase n=1 Tax=Limnohabitans sp. TS-CS-82 TaxID=2094193 RepID=UPI000CF28A1A|nr:FAD-dependent oxidoreductase [Limnohabitans sp. TS-CS-82]PQA82710.1 FAD-dependent oxidoreductase [Limnohabitans sp. TS-CS-82]
MTHHVILGAGPAGVIAAETIRKHAPNDRITLVGDEAEPPYSRMAIPYLLIGNIDERGTYLRKGADHYASLGVTQVQARALSVDAKTKTIQLSNDQVLAYDKLLIATGSRPVRPPIPGMDSPQVHPCWTLEDARAIMALAQPGARVVQMGAGFIGCIIMEALASRGVTLTVVEMGDRMVPRMMGPVAGGMIRSWCETKGVQVFTGAKVEAIVPNGSENPGLLSKLAQAVGLHDAPTDAALTVRLSTGDKIPADLVISATGVKPCIDFLKTSGITCLQGVLTDEHMQTNADGVYAAGDCAEAFDKVSGTTIVSAIQPNAAEQARVAALNMVGQQASLKGVTQINVLDTLGLISTSFGNWQGVPGGEQASLTAEGRHLSLQFKDDVMVGCNSVGWTEHVGVMRGLVEGQVHLGAWKDKLKQDPTQLMAAYLACAQGQGAWTGAADTRRR